jgi:hypothetical protein
MLALPKRADVVARCRHVLNTTFSKLFADENFVTLLRAESITDVPICLKSVFEEGVQRTNEIG